MHSLTVCSWQSSILNRQSSIIDLPVTTCSPKLSRQNTRPDPPVLATPRTGAGKTHRSLSGQTGQWHGIEGSLLSAQAWIVQGILLTRSKVQTNSILFGGGEGVNYRPKNGDAHSCPTGPWPGPVVHPGAHRQSRSADMAWAHGRRQVYHLFIRISGYLFFVDHHWPPLLTANQVWTS